MKKPKPIANKDLLNDLMHSVASIQAQLSTLFLMQCELFAYLNKSESPPIAQQWSDVQMDSLNQNLEALTERLKRLAG